MPPTHDTDPAPPGTNPTMPDSMTAMFGRPNAFARQFDFWDAQYEGRRLFSELLGTFFLALVAVEGWCGMLFSVDACCRHRAS